MDRFGWSPEKTSGETSSNGHTTSSERASQTMSEAKKGAQRILGCYRVSDAHDPEIYISAVVAVLAMYPVEVIRNVTIPETGIPSKIKWLPTIAEIKEACEGHYRAKRYAKEWDAGARKQAEERLEIPDYRPKPMHAVRQYIYGEYMEMTGWKGRPIGRFEIKSEFAKEGESRDFAEPRPLSASELQVTDALLKVLSEEDTEGQEQRLAVPE